ncbi:MAG: hypothetical protein HYY26_05095, partial [Acidobacteria bacterium]|nr:hypothetical protein [Acidobacteriota bacterium]
MSALSAAADIIVLKSGTRIEAWGVEERGDKVYYEGPAGQVALPRRLVERIERSDALPSWATAGSQAAAELPPPDLPALGDPDVTAVIAGDKIDREVLARLEVEAERNGSEAARQRAAAAHVLIAQFLFSRGQVPAAGDAVRRALSFAPQEPALLLFLAVLEVEQQRYAAALEHLRPVLNGSRYLFEAYRLEGWIHYQSEDMPRAIAAWKRALAERSDSELEALLARTEREAQAAEAFEQRGSGRFELRFDGGEVPTRVAAGILAALENMYGEMASTFNVAPRQPIVVLLYANQTFYELTGLPAEVHGLFDGKIRVPVRGLVSLAPELERTLRHELVHAFVFVKTRGHSPRWLQEGLAQWHAGQRPWVGLETFRPLFEPRDGTSLVHIEVGFAGDAAQVMGSYYASWLVVDTLERRYGSAGMLRF